ncbi:MAG: 4-amino-4-deoxychorismate lyase [Cellvibrionaceae bacterium]|jgi:4-amino-4-deoxychorismate lyase
MMADPEKYTFVDGSPRADLPLSDRGLAYGDGLFETMLVVNQLIPLWSLHKARLFSGLRKLGIFLRQNQLDHHLQQIEKTLQQGSRDYWIHKLIVTRGSGGYGYRPEPESPATIISQLFPKCESPLNRIEASIHLCRQRLTATPAWPGLKTLNQLLYVLASRERHNTSFDEGLLLSVEGDLIEATARNLFILKNGMLFTPKIGIYGVNGTMRRLIIENLAPVLDLKTVEKSLSVDDLRFADEAFLCNAVTGIWPVISYSENGRDCSRWYPGAITRKLQNDLNSWVHKTI